MAAKKRTAKKKAVAKRPTMDVATIQQQMQNEVANIQDQIGTPASNSIKIRDKVFTLPNGQIIQGPIKAVIVDFISRNMHYEGKWDPKNPVPPTCFAINKVVSAMTPSDNSPDKQADNCAECPMNQFGSDGDGKACKNTRLLALVLPDLDGDDEGKLYTMSVPPTAIKGFDAYVNSVAKLYNVPPVGVVTKIGFHPEKSYPMPIFSDPEPNSQLQEHFVLRDEAEIMLTAEPDVSGAAPKPARRKRAG